MPSPTMSSPSKISLRKIVALLLLFASSSSVAIDLSRAFSKPSKVAAAADNNDGPSSNPVPMSSEDALLNAKKLVNDLNDAATGTVTSYQPGREKEPVTCNEIMAKSLVVANEEKAAIIAEKNAVVKAAALLSEKMDDLESQLKIATQEIDSLERMVADANTDCEVKLKDAMDDAERDIQEAEQTLSAAKANHEAELKEFMDDVERERQQADKAMNEFKADHESKLKLVLTDTENYTKQAQSEIMAEKERSKINMDALKNATSATISKIEKETADKLAAKEAEVSKLLSEMKKDMASIQSDTERSIKESKRMADDMVASINAKADRDRARQLEAHTKQIQDVKIEAKKRMDSIKQDLSDAEDGHQKELSELKAAHAQRMKNVEQLRENMIQEKQEEMERALDKAKGIISHEQEKNGELEGKLQKQIDLAEDTRMSLGKDIKMLRTTSLNLRDEVNFWKETHSSQGYCNTTLIREDSRRLVMGAVGNAGRGLESGHKAMMAGLATQLDLVQNTGADVMLFIEKELLPTIERIVDEAYEKARALYDAHLAVAVNEKLLPLFNQHVKPVYNQHFLPIYLQHVSPVVKTIEGEAAVAIEISQKEVQKARSGAAKLVKQSSSSALGVMKEKEIDSFLPGWVLSLIARSSKDGEWAVDMLCKGLLIFIVILSRSLIKRIILGMFSLVWFFCPLRLFVGGRRKVVENGAKEVNTSTKKIQGVQKPKTNGKAKVY